MAPTTPSAHSSKPPRLQAALAKAHHVLAARTDSLLVEKTIWGSPAGKKRIAARLAKMLPGHRVYTEPFAGSAAVLFAKPVAPVEAINDADPEIADAYQLIQRLTSADMDRLRQKSWVGNEKHFKALFDAEPKTDLERLYRYLYVTHFSYGKLRSRSFSPNAVGIEATTLKRIEKFGPRLRNVHIHSGDYEPVVQRYDAKDTVHFLDPPYPGYNVDVGESKFDEQRFFDGLKKLKGRWLITYGIRGKFPKLVKSTSWWTKRIRTPRTIASMRGVGGSQYLTQLLVANYEPAKKSLESDAEVQFDEWDGLVEDEPLAFHTTSKLLKGVDPNDERFVLGIVLEPEVVDLQGDIYSAEEVRNAAHLFMEEYGGLGLQHRLRVNGQVKVLESYLAPADFTVGETTVKKDTWLLAVRVLSDALWERVRSGDLTGFSIGGSARRVPESDEASTQPESGEPAAEAS